MCSSSDIISAWYSGCYIGAVFASVLQKTIANIGNNMKYKA